VKKLLAGGANVGARRNDGLTAHELAIRNGHDRVAATLPRPGQNRVTPSALAPTAVRRTWSSA
jgi:ankyrin repeat protein